MRIAPEHIDDGADRLDDGIVVVFGQRVVRCGRAKDAGCNDCHKYPVIRFHPAASGNECD
jgi:hypothetical protein